MEEEFKRIYDCISNSEEGLLGEYFLVHADHVHDFKRALEHYFDENALIEKLDDRYYDEVNKCFCGRQMLGETVLVDKINEIIDKLNRTER